MSVPRQPSAWYQLSSTCITPCLQLMAQYSVVCKYWHESDFSTWDTITFIILVQLENVLMAIS